MIVLESDPPQYTAQVMVIQPNGCATFGHVQARQLPDETDIFLNAFNEVVVGETVSCDDAISTFVQPVPLGVDFEPDVTYTISGGGATTTFTPQGQAEPAGPVGEEPTPTPAPTGAITLGLKVIPDGANFLFVAELIGGQDNEEGLYCRGWTLSPGDGNVIAIMPGCVMYTPDVEIPRHFEMSHAYEEPGVYEAVFEYGHLTSNSVTVVVKSVDPKATATPAPFGTSSGETAPAKMVWPTLLTLDPETLAPGHQVTVLGQGGYLFTPPSGYNESSRLFDLYFDGDVTGTFSCYVNRCEATITVPADALPGVHEVSVEGGSSLELVLR